MATKTVPARTEVPADFKWNLEAVFPQDDLWESEFTEIAPLINRIKGFQGRLGENASVLLDALKLRDDINYRLERLYAYARMRRDEDNTNAHYQALEDRARALWARVEEASSFFNPEVLEVGRERVDDYLTQNADLKLYAHLLDDLYREAEHMLSAREEAPRSRAHALGPRRSTARRSRRGNGGPIANLRHAE
jgi:oligoendopeptidase F